MVARIKKNDTVVVITGRDKGKQGVVIEVVPNEGKALVKDVAIVTKHLKARKSGDVAGIKKIESYIDMSNLMPLCTNCKTPCRVNVKILEQGKRVRICSSCKEAF
jgi:large subunit ribosomal protein L24